mmetsp:Transcript_36014/g.87027  ORF Transcript_36014/g.87027 Transcript_36014/m.87027 type:complete len:224 (-) Transcript_36014:37-708(-)
MFREPRVQGRPFTVGALIHLGAVKLHAQIVEHTHYELLLPLRRQLPPPALGLGGRRPLGCPRRHRPSCLCWCTRSLLPCQPGSVLLCCTPCGPFLLHLALDQGQLRAQVLRLPFELLARPVPLLLEPLHSLLGLELGLLRREHLALALHHRLTHRVLLLNQKPLLLHQRGALPPQPFRLGSAPGSLRLGAFKLPGQLLAPPAAAARLRLYPRHQGLEGGHLLL